MSRLRMTLLIPCIFLSAIGPARGRQPPAAPDRPTVFWHAGVSGIAFSPDSKVLASASQDGSLRLWDLTTGQQLRRLAAHADGVRCVAFSPDGKTVATGGQDAGIHLWEVSTGTLLRQFIGHQGPVFAVAFSP